MWLFYSFLISKNNPSISSSIHRSFCTSFSFNNHPVSLFAATLSLFRVSQWPHQSVTLLSKGMMSLSPPPRDTHTVMHRKCSSLWQLSEHLTNPSGLFSLWPLPPVNVCRTHCSEQTLTSLQNGNCTEIPCATSGAENRHQTSICLKIPKTKHVLDVCIWCVQPGVWRSASMAVSLHYFVGLCFFCCVECLVTGWHAVFGKTRSGCLDYINHD